MGKTEERKALRRPWCIWEDNNKMDLKAVGCGAMEWIDLARNRDSLRVLVKVVLKLQVP